MTTETISHDPADSFFDLAERLRAARVDEATIGDIATHAHRERQEAVLETTRLFGKGMLTFDRFADALELHGRRIHATIAACTTVCEDDDLAMGLHQLLYDLSDEARRLGHAFDALRADRAV